MGETGDLRSPISPIFNLKSSISAIAVLTLALLIAACARYGPEQTLLDQFFSASRLRDKTALQAFATVPFEPHVQGTVTTFTIVRVSPDEHKPLNMRESERRITEISVDDPRQPIDVSKYAGEMVSKDVTIQAPVRLPNGRTARKILNVILQRAILKGDRDIVGRWIVTGFAVR